MIRQAILPVFTALLLASAGSLISAKEETVLDLALTELELDQRDLQPDPLMILSTSSKSGGAFPMLRSLLSDPLAAGYRVGMAEGRFVDLTQSPLRMFLSAVSLTNAGISRGYLGNPLRELDNKLLSAEDPLAEALRLLEEQSGVFDWKDNLPDLDSLPNPTRFELARVIGAIWSAERFRRRAFSELPKDLDGEEMLKQIMRNRFDDFQGDDYRMYIRDVEFASLCGGMLDLQAALEDFDDFLDQNPDLPELQWRQNTPLGEIIIDFSLEDNEWSSKSPLLMIDLGGNDSYFAKDERQWRKGTSIIYDREGDDLYFSEPGKAGGSIFGYGVVWDMAGNDVYKGEYLSQAGTMFGATMLLDQSGDDVYSATAFSQGYALAGVSLLVDLGGDDSFESVISSQASGGPMGAGVLVNVGGDDQYLLKNEPLIDPSPQSPKHNASMGQGMGCGLRADLSDGRSLPGGCGFLIDTEGDDRYTAQVFAQGSGYLEGTGLLVDGAGRDEYRGVYYVQASAAHRAGAVLIDRGNGDDSYIASEYTSIAVGHDLSTGFFLDEAGNDIYHVKNLGIGVGNDNGVGIFVDGGGDDQYTVDQKDGYALGGARIENWGTSRENARSLGLFFDLGGTDQYNIKRDGPKDNSLWPWKQKYPDLDLPCEQGLGIDGEYTMPFHTGPKTDSNDIDSKRIREAREARRRYRAILNKADPE